MKLATTALALTVLLSGSAFAGGNPDEEDFGVGTREVLQDAQPLAVTTPDPAPVIPDQHRIQREVEAEIRRGWVEMNLSAPRDNDAVNAEPVASITIARAESESKCKHPFEFLDDLIGGCYELNATLGDKHVLTAEDGPQFETRTRIKTKVFKSKRYAKRFAKRKASKGYDVEIERIRTKRGKRFKVTATKSYQVEVESDSGAGSGGVQGGDTGRERDEHGPESNY